MESSVFYAPTCGFYDFKCQETDSDLFPMIDENESYANLGCNKINFITADFQVKKAEEVTEEYVIQAFEMATNSSHKPEAIKREAKIYLRALKRQTKKQGQ
jgi:hypothetical protein